MEKKTIFFDLDDTLYDRSVPYCEAFLSFFGGKYAEKAQQAWGEPLADGKAKRDPSLGELDIYASPAVAIGSALTVASSKCRSAGRALSWSASKLSGSVGS